MELKGITGLLIGQPVARPETKLKALSYAWTKAAATGPTTTTTAGDVVENSRWASSDVLATPSDAKSNPSPCIPPTTKLVYLSDQAAPSGPPPPGDRFSVWSSAAGGTIQPPPRRYLRVRPVTDADRECNFLADQLASNISVPRSWEPSVSLLRAQRQNRNQQQRLVVTLADIDRRLLRQFREILNSERRVLAEFLAKYPDMYDQVMAGFQDQRSTLRKLGFFPSKPKEMGRPIVRPGTDRAKSNAFKARPRSQGTSEFPPVVQGKVRMISKGREFKDARKPDHLHRSKSDLYDMQLNGVKFDKTPRNVKERPQKLESMPSELPQISDKASAYIRTPGTNTTKTDDTSVKVTCFVDTDFGFHVDRQREISGMSLQKHIPDRDHLARDIERTAEKHINALMTSGLNSRSSKKAENVQNLMTTMNVKTKRGQGQLHPKVLTKRSQAGRCDDDVDNSTSPTRITLPPRRPTIKSGGTMPLLEKDIGAIVIVGKEAGNNSHQHHAT